MRSAFTSLLFTALVVGVCAAQEEVQDSASDSAIPEFKAPDAQEVVDSVIEQTQENAVDSVLESPQPTGDSLQPGDHGSSDNSEIVYDNATPLPDASLDRMLDGSLNMIAPASSIPLGNHDCGPIPCHFNPAPVTVAPVTYVSPAVYRAPVVVYRTNIITCCYQQPQRRGLFRHRILRRFR